MKRSWWQPKVWVYARVYGSSRRVAARNVARAWVAGLVERWRWIDPWRRWRCDHVHDLLIYRTCQHMICCYCGSRSWKKERSVNKAEDFIKKVPPEYLP